MKVGVGILGGTGFGASELLRLLTQHPEAEVVSVVSRSMAGKPLTETHTHLEGFYNMNFDAALDLEKFSNCESKVVFSAMPHGESAKAISELSDSAVKEGLKIVDLSGDFRLKNVSLHQQYYPESDAPESLREQFIYGVSELNASDIVEASFIANPWLFSCSFLVSSFPFCCRDR